MAGGEVGAAVLQVLVQNLIDVSKSEISLIRGVKKEAEMLTSNLDSIQKFLNDAEKRTDPGKAVKNWLKNLENVAFDANNVLDELNYHLLSKKIMAAKKPMKENVLRKCFSPFIHIAGKRNVAARIKEFNMDLESINKKATELGLQSMLAVAPTTPYAGMETDAITVDPIFIGRDDVVLEIVEKLTISIATDDDERGFSIFPIMGMGGLGKSTLTRRVFNHHKIETHFGSCIWVHVSQTFDPNIILMKILKELTLQSGLVVESRQEILKKLQQALKGKTYLLVLDDVWNEDSETWENFMNALSGVTSTKGNSIVVTTRREEVTSIVRPHHVHKLNGLSEEDCWSIIKAKAFGKKQVSSEFETIGRNIAKRCQGLPLAANVVGGILCNKSEDKWHSIEQKWLSDGEKDDISKILRLSFDNLISPSLKKCFAYCSIFPKGDKILKDELIELWMAEGFLQPDGSNDMESDGSNDMESVGDKFYNVLLHSSLLQVARREMYDYENVERCAMHDLVHDLASFLLGNNADGPNRVRYMWEEDGSSLIPKEVAKYLRTLFFEGASPIINFSNFKCLHVLTLTGDEVEELPNSIRKLIHLRNLNISCTRITYLPEWIGELHYLQTLRAKRLKKLPTTLKYLINLRHLHIRHSVELPAEIGRLTSLQTLKVFRVGDTNGYKIEELGSLDNLKGELMICNLDKVRDKEEADKANLCKKSKLFELCLTWDAYREVGEVNDENVLEGLQPHSNLKKLEIFGYRGKRFPSWTMEMAVRNEPQGSWVGLHKLTEIRLSCIDCDEIMMLGHLPNLNTLSLENLFNLRFIESSFYGIDKWTRIAFPALETLRLENMLELTEWANVEEFGSKSEEVKVFPRLQNLEISDCERLMNAPTNFSSSLTTLCIDGVGGNLPSIYMSKSMSLTKLSIGKLDGWEFLPDRLFYNNQNLSELKISECPMLRELPDGLHNLRSLEICECGELIDLPIEVLESSVPSLEELSLANSCVEIESDYRDEILEISVSVERLKESGVAIKMIVDGILQRYNNSDLVLRLKGMEIWGCLQESIQHLTALCELAIENFEDEELPEWFGNLSSLMLLTLSNCNKLRRQPSLDAMESFSSLEIKDCPVLRIDSAFLENFNVSINVDGIDLIQPSSRNSGDLRRCCF